jgi:hypothetical protein
MVRQREKSGSAIEKNGFNQFLISFGEGTPIFSTVV